MQRNELERRFRKAHSAFSNYLSKSRSDQGSAPREFDTSHAISDLIGRGITSSFEKS